MNGPPAWDPALVGRLIAIVNSDAMEDDDVDVAALADQLQAAIAHTAALTAALREACDLATPVTAERARDVAAEGYLVELQPMFVQIGDVVVAERLLELRALAGEP